jgi:hypothetical protein
MTKKLLRTLLPVAVTAAMLLVAGAAVAECGARDAAAQQSCKTVHAKTLPADLRKYLVKSGCDVKAGSNYDEGYALDLNGDGNLEYVYCCTEARHGPCGMKIFARSVGRWMALSDEVYITGDTSIACDGFTPLTTKTSGYNDLCIGDGTVLRFTGGQYAE